MLDPSTNPRSELWSSDWWYKNSDQKYQFQSLFHGEDISREQRMSDVTL